MEFFEPNSASGQNYIWKKNCILFAETDSFNSFRSFPILIHIADGIPSRAGKWYLRRLKRNKLFRQYIDKFITSDLIGSPKNKIKFRFKNSLKNFEISPLTLRFINNIFNIIEIFGDDILTGTIAEIGAGFGGESKIANDVFKIGKKWNIYDLESSLPLIKRWLRCFGYEANLNPDLNGADLVISNHAFSELTLELQDLYFEKVIALSKNGYFMTNFERCSVSGYTTETFINKLKESGKYVYRLDVNKWLSNFDKDEGGELIVFSENSINIPDRSLIGGWEINLRKLLLSIPINNKIPFINRYLSDK